MQNNVMDKAKIILIEDSEGWRNDIRADLEAGGHVVEALACSVETALLLVDLFAQSPGSLDVAVVDGNLSPGSENGADGERVAEDIHSRLPGVVVIGISLDGTVPGADLNVPKDSSRALHKAISDL